MDPLHRSLVTQGVTCAFNAPHIDLSHSYVFWSAAEELNKKNGWDLRIHVDAASGGFIAPFIYPDLEFDFRLKNVNSVSASGHKYECN